MKKIIPFLLTLAICSLLFSCKKTKTPIENKPTHDVYISGYEYLTTPTGFTYRAVYYKNGEKTYLTGANEYAQAKSITLIGNDVYVMGTFQDGTKNTVVYWKNGNKVVILSDVTGVTIQDIKMVGNDFYTLGIENGSVFYWKNNVKTILSNGTISAHADKIFIENNTVYVVGGYGTSPTKAAYWKNGNLNLLSNGPKNGAVTGVKVVGSDEYFTYIDDVNAYYQKNNVNTLLGLGSTNYIQVAGNHVYTLGATYTTTFLNTAGYWKNGNFVALGALNQNLGISKILVVDDDLYMIGSYFYFPIGAESYFWKNDKPTTIRKGHYFDLITDIFVQ
jgi:hypothetical protein